MPLSSAAVQAFLLPAGHHSLSLTLEKAQLLTGVKTTWMTDLKNVSKKSLATSGTGQLVPSVTEG